MYAVFHTTSSCMVARGSGAEELHTLIVVLMLTMSHHHTTMFRVHVFSFCQCLPILNSTKGMNEPLETLSVTVSIPGTLRHRGLPYFGERQGNIPVTLIHNTGDNVPPIVP